MNQPTLTYKQPMLLPLSNAVSCQRAKFAVKFLRTRGFTSEQICKEADIELADLFDAYLGKFCKMHVLINLRQLMCKVAS